MITQLFIYNESTISNKLNSTRFLANEILSIEKFFDSSKYYFLF